MRYVLVIAYLILTVSGLTLMKLGGNPGSIEFKAGTISLGMSLFSFFGFICYIGSFLLFTKIVTMFNLSYIYPIITGIVQVLALIISAFILKENITMHSTIGAIIIIIGIIIMNIRQIN